MLTLRIVGIEIVETWNSEKSGFVNANNANTTVMSKRTVQTSPQNDWIIRYPSRWFTIQRDGIIVESSPSTWIQTASWPRKFTKSGLFAMWGD